MCRVNPCCQSVGLFALLVACATEPPPLALTRARRIRREGNMDGDDSTVVRLSALAVLAPATMPCALPPEGRGALAAGRAVIA